MAMPLMSHTCGSCASALRRGTSGHGVTCGWMANIAGGKALPFWLKRELMTGDGAECLAWEPSAEFTKQQHRLADKIIEEERTQERHDNSQFGVGA